MEIPSPLDSVMPKMLSILALEGVYSAVHLSRLNFIFIENPAVVGTKQSLLAEDIDDMWVVLRELARQANTVAVPAPEINVPIGIIPGLEKPT